MPSSRYWFSSVINRIREGIPSEHSVNELNENETKFQTTQCNQYFNNMSHHNFNFINTYNYDNEEETESSNYEYKDVNDNKIDFNQCGLSPIKPIQSYSLIEFLRLMIKQSTCLSSNVLLNLFYNIKRNVIPLLNKPYTHSQCIENNDLLSIFQRIINPWIKKENKPVLLKSSKIEELDDSYNSNFGSYQKELESRFDIKHRSRELNEEYLYEFPERVCQSFSHRKRLADRHISFIGSTNTKPLITSFSRYASPYHEVNHDVFNYQNYHDKWRYRLE